jgi:sugar phosphate isomerase/epimerase
MPVNMILLFAMVCGSYAEEIRPFFAFENAFRGDADYATLDEQCKLLVELGYDGIGPSGVDGIPKMIETLDKYNIALSALYVRLTVEEDRATYDRSLETVLERLAGRETVIWLYCPKGKTKPHAPEADATLVAELRHLAELAEKAELKLAIYPHAGFYLATIEETERIVEKVDHPNVGLSWNLCHRLKTAGSEGIEEELERILPKLFCVSINGADPSGKDWSSLIQPLGEGAFDNARLMSHLQEMGYRGPVGLQCYGVPGSAREKLRRSMKAWKRIETKAAESSSAKE